MKVAAYERQKLRIKDDGTCNTSYTGIEEPLEIRLHQDLESLEKKIQGLETELKTYIKLCEGQELNNKTLLKQYSDTRKVLVNIISDKNKLQEAYNNLCTNILGRYRSDISDAEFGKLMKELINIEENDTN